MWNMSATLSVSRRGENHSEEHRSVHPLGHVAGLSDRRGLYDAWNPSRLCCNFPDEHRESGIGTGQCFDAAPRRTITSWSIFSCCELDPNLFDVMKHTMQSCLRNSACLKSPSAEGPRGLRREVTYLQTPSKETGLPSRLGLLRRRHYCGIWLQLGGLHRIDREPPQHSIA